MNFNIKMEYLKVYNSDNEKEEIAEYQADDFKLSAICDIQMIPEVDITGLVSQKEQDIVNKFESGYYIPDKKNHLTGYINYHTMNDFNFNEQMYTYNAYGFAQDPTDFTQDKMIGNTNKFEDPNFSKSVYTGSNKIQKEYKRKLRMGRMKYGNPASGEFMGPWATYEGEEMLKNPSGKELTEEQKQILEQMEVKRQQKFENTKEQETKFLNVS
jgi:hypothetical protein